jgi:hypothetical protein
MSPTKSEMIKRLLDLAQTSLREDPLKSAEWGKERIVSGRRNVKDKGTKCPSRVVRYTPSY